MTPSDLRILPAVEYLEIGDEIGVVAETRNQARARIAALTGVDYVQIRARRDWRRICDCEGCAAGHADDFHGFDEWWLPCGKDDPRAVGWWVG